MSGTAFDPPAGSENKMPRMWLVHLLFSHTVTIKIKKPAPRSVPTPQPAQHPAETGRPLVVVGAGKLGRRVAALWQDAEGGKAPVYAVCRTPNEHRDVSLRAAGITPCLKEDRGTLPGLCPHVLFCVPPGQRESDLLLYSGVISSALGRWDHLAEGASFVFTSSAGVYAEQEGSVVTEESLTADTVRAMRYQLESSQRAVP